MNPGTSRHCSTWNYLHSDFERKMQQIAEKWFDEKQLPKHNRYPYILRGHELWKKNIILAEVAEYINKEQERREAEGHGFPLHKYLHHGLSSQAMLFNLIGPLLLLRDWSPLRDAFALASVPWPPGEIEVTLEVSDHKVLGEDPRHPTSLDFAIRGEGSGPNLFIESKLVEKEFGGCSVFSRGDCEGMNPAQDFDLCYLHHFRRQYWPRLEELEFLHGQFQDSPICLLAQYYQFFREVLFALSQGGYFVLLVDRRNPTFIRESSKGARGLMPFLINFVPQAHRHRIKSIFVQQIVQAIRESGRHDHWVGEFDRKYGIT